MWSFFSHSPTKVKSVEERLQGSLDRLRLLVNKAIEASYSTGRTDTQLISVADLGEAITALLTLLIEEDTAHTEDQSFGSGMMWTFSQSLFDQLTAWAQLDQPQGMFSKVLFFFTMLVIDVHNQPILQHVGFNRALLSLLIITDERLKRGQLFTEAKETAIPLVHAISCRVLQDASLCNCFIVKDGYHPPQYILVPVLEYFLKTEVREDVNALECVEMMGQTEDEDVLSYLLTESTLLQTVARRLIRHLVSLPRTASRLSQAVKSRELEDVCRSIRYLDSFCCTSLHPPLVKTLVDSLLTDCFQPYVAPNIRSSEVEMRGLFTTYLLQMASECVSRELLLCIAQMLRGSDSVPHSHGRFESSSTMVSGQHSEMSHTPTRSTWEAFIANLQSPNALLRNSSLKLLYTLLTRNQWELVQVLVTDAFQGRAPVWFTTCGYEEFLSNFPGSLIYSDMRTATLYYHECINQVLSETLPRCESAGWAKGSESGDTEVAGGTCLELDLGQVTKMLLGKLESLLMNTVEENLLVTGILTSLSRIPALNPSATTLYYTLFSTSEDSSMLSVLKKVTFTQIDRRIQTVAEETSNFESALYGARKALGLSVDAAMHADKNYTELIYKKPAGVKGGNVKKIRDTHFIEVSDRQGVVIYQEFVRELSGCVLAQEQMTLMRDCFQDSDL